MKRTIHVKPAAPQYSVITNITFAQTDAWFGHTTQDLRMDLIYPEDTAHDYPCIVWICGGAWLSIDKSAHLAYLSELASRFCGGIRTVPDQQRSKISGTAL